MWSVAQLVMSSAPESRYVRSIPHPSKVFCKCLYKMNIMDCKYIEIKSRLLRRTRTETKTDRQRRTRIQTDRNGIRKWKGEERRWGKLKGQLNIFLRFFLRFINLVSLKIIWAAIYFKAVHLRAVVCVNVANFGFIALVLRYSCLFYVNGYF